MNNQTLDIMSLDPDTAHRLAKGLEAVLNARTHKHSNVYGDEVVVPGSLSKALKLPQIILQLANKSGHRQAAAQERLAEIWPTLSPSTRQKALEQCDIYDPNELEWDDPRSNRRPLI